MIFHDADGSELLKVSVENDSYRFQELMGEDQLVLKFSLTEHIELPTGAYCIYPEQAGGKKYTLITPSNVTVKHRRDFEYTVVLEGAQAFLRKHRLYNPIDGRLKFDYTAQPQEHLKLLVDNLCDRYGAGSWESGDCVESTEKLISYSHNTILDALNAIAETFETEWQVTTSGGKHIISIGKVEYGADNPLPLSYGNGNGFVSGVSRSNYNDELPVGKLYIEGGDRNIDYSKYPSSDTDGQHSATLLLPSDEEFSFDGEKFGDEYGFNPERSVDMVTDERGFSVKLSDAPSDTNEDSIDLTEIYPKRVGKVSQVLFWNSRTKEYITPTSSSDWKDIEIDIVDDSIPEDLNFSDCIIGGETMTLVFQDGMLVSREFNVTYRHKEQSGRPARRFELVKGDFDGQTMPSAAYLPAVNDHYAIFNIMLPNAYIRSKVSDPEHSGKYIYSGAEYEALREAAQYLFKNKGAKYTFKGELDALYAKRNWANISSSIVVGGVIRFTDASIVGKEKHYDLRIASVKDYINNPHSPTIELTDEAVYSGAGGGLSGELKKLEGDTVHSKTERENVVNYTKRGFRDAKETSSMLQDVFAETWGSTINPISLHTMQLIAGDESLQIRFWQREDCTGVISTPVSVNISNYTINCVEAYLQHLTWDVKNPRDLTVQRPYTSYHRWHISRKTFQFEALNPDLAYYVYAQCDREAEGVYDSVEEAEYILSAAPMESNESYQYYLIGILNSEHDASRSYVSVYGFTEILPNQITTSKIVDSDGTSFIDLEGGEVRIGGDSSEPYFEWNRGGDSKLRIHGALNVDGGGAEAPAIVTRGDYNPENTYYWGDLVTFEGSTYLCIYEYGDVKGKDPTDTDYWKRYISKGDKGDDGDSLLVQYSKDGTSWHDTYAEGDEYMRIYSEKKWGSAVRIKGEDGERGPEGQKAPYVNFMFAISAYTSGNPYPSDISSSSWKDTPPAVTAAKPYLWCREQHYSVNSANEWVLDRTSYYRITGEKGPRGEDGTITKHQWAITVTKTAPAESAWKNNFSDVSDHFGYYLWQRILESEDGGATWVVNAATVGIIQDPTVSREEAQAMELVSEQIRQITAEKLGYSSWDEFSVAVAASSVIIQGGYLNASLIDTELLITKILKTALERQRVEVDKDGMTIYDDNENVVARFHGGYLSSIYNFTNVSGAQTSVTVFSGEYLNTEKNEGEEEGVVGDMNLTVNGEVKYTGRSFEITNEGESRVAGQLKFDLSTECRLENVSSTEAILFNIYSANVHSIVYLSTSETSVTGAIRLGEVNAYQPSSNVNVTKTLDFTQILKKGRYYIWVEEYAAISLKVIEAPAGSIRYYRELQATENIHADSPAVVQLISEKLEVFANGIGYRHNQNDYAVVLRTGGSKASNGFLQMEVQSGKAGLRLGQDDSGNSYLLARNGHDYFQLAPKMMLKVHWNASGSGSYSLAYYMVRGSSNGTAPSVSKDSTNGVIINLPSDTSEVFSDSDICMAMCHVTSSSQHIFAEAQRMTDKQMKVYTTNSNSNPERCDVSIMIW